jgi:hypothetical protein
MRSFEVTRTVERARAWTRLANFDGIHDPEMLRHVTGLLDSDNRNRCEVI